MNSNKANDIAAKFNNDIYKSNNQKADLFMDLLEPIVNSFRIDKNMAYNIEDFSENVVRSLVIYFSHSYQSNFFGFGTFDPEHFAKTMGYSLSYLQREHSNPIQFKGLTSENIKELKEDERKHPENRLFDSILENALYFLTEPIRFRRGGKLSYWKDGGKYYSEIYSFQYLKSISCQFTRSKKGKGKDKVLYNYTVTPEFLNNINGFYLTGNIQSHIKLRKHGLDDLYFYLKNVQNSLEGKLENSIHLRFDDLATKAKLSEKYSKPEKKRHLGLSLKKINDQSEVKFRFDFIKGGNSRWAYVPHITFENKIITAAQKNKHIDVEKTIISDQILIHEFRGMFQMLAPNRFYHAKRVENFIQWLKSEIHVKEKLLAYDNAYLKTYGKLHHYHENSRHSFFKNIKSMHSLHEMFPSIPVSVENETKQLNYY